MEYYVLFIHAKKAATLTNAREVMSNNSPEVVKFSDALSENISQSVQPVEAPCNGSGWETYRLADVLPSWMVVPRTKRQRGKIKEAQKFRRVQGAYLEARLHFTKLTTSAESQLKWWFSNMRRISIHHFIMKNYYLHDRPTTVEQLIKEEFGGLRVVMADLKAAREMGSIEIDKMAEDQRKATIYPTRGLIADTDNFFGSVEAGKEGMFVKWAEELDRVSATENGGVRIRLADYHREYAAYTKQVDAILPDTIRTI